MAVTELRSGSRRALGDGAPWAICCARADLLQKGGTTRVNGTERQGPIMPIARDLNTKQREELLSTLKARLRKT